MKLLIVYHICRQKNIFDIRSDCPADGRKLRTKRTTAVEGITVPMARNRRKREPQNPEKRQKIWLIE